MEHNRWVQYEKTQRDFWHHSMDRLPNNAWAGTFMQNEPEHAVSPRTFEQWLHGQAWEGAEHQILQRLATNLTVLLGEAWLPPRLSNITVQTNEQAVATLAQMRREKMYARSYGLVAQALTPAQIAADPVIRDAIATTHAPDNLNCDADMARLLGRYQIIPDWVLNHFSAEGSSQVFFNVAVEQIREDRIGPLLARFTGEHKAEAAMRLFVMNFSRRSPFSVPTVEMLRNLALESKTSRYFPVGVTHGGTVYGNVGQKVINLVEEEGGLILKMLSCSVELSPDLLSWSLRHLRMTEEWSKTYQPAVLFRVLQDGMLDDWLGEQGLAGIPGDLRYEVVESQFPTWNSLQELPLNNPTPLVGNALGCSC